MKLLIHLQTWEFHPTLYNGCNYLSMPGLKLIDVNKSGIRVSLFYECGVKMEGVYMNVMAAFCARNPSVTGGLQVIYYFMCPLR